MTLHAFSNGRVLAGHRILDGAEIMVTDGVISGIAPLSGTGRTATDLDRGWLLPGFVDVQVNGGGGTLFNDCTDVAGIGRIAAAHARYGTTALLPTLISDTPDRIALALDAVDDAIAQQLPGVVGVHIEGPVLNPARKGIHDETRFSALDGELLTLLTRPRNGRVLVTLAPERADPAAIAALVDAGVIVSIGHSEASYEDALAAFDVGTTGVTHLFNAMPALTQRAPGLVGAALSDPRPWCGLIVDGLHVSPVVLRLAMRLRPANRMMLVTDAMPSVGNAGSGFVLQGRQIDLVDGRLADADGTLAGAHLDMAGAVANCVKMLGVSVPQAAAMASANPAAFLRLAEDRGELAIGKRADWVLLDASLRPVGTVIGGERVA